MTCRDCTETLAALAAERDRLREALLEVARLVDGYRRAHGRGPIANSKPFTDILERVCRAALAPYTASSDKPATNPAAKPDPDATTSAEAFRNGIETAARWVETQQDDGWVAYGFAPSIAASIRALTADTGEEPRHDE